MIAACSVIAPAYSLDAGKTQPRYLCPLAPPRSWSWVDSSSTSPFGSDFTPEELVLARALRHLAASTGHWTGKVRMLARALAAAPAEAGLAPYLARMSLANPSGGAESLQRRLLVTALRDVLAQ